MKSVNYIVKIDGSMKVDTMIPKIKNYPSIDKIIYNYNSNKDKVLIKIYSKENLTNMDNLLSSITNHGLPDCDVVVKVISTNWFTRLIKPILLYMEFNSYGVISNLRMA